MQTRTDDAIEMPTGAVHAREPANGETDETASFPERLRDATRDAHRRLEDAVGIARETVERDRIVRFLQRMRAVHAAWEPWAARSALDPAFLARRRKLHLIDEDLAALGAGDPARLPVCPRWPGPASLDRVAGSMYVLEGSTLGGRVIGRWIGAAEWRPSKGLHYFDCYGSDTGAMWRETRAKLAEVAAFDREERIILAARETFDRLHGWFAGEGDIG